MHATVGDQIRNCVDSSEIVEISWRLNLIASLTLTASIWRRDVRHAFPNPCISPRSDRIFFSSSPSLNLVKSINNVHVRRYTRISGETSSGPSFCRIMNAWETVSLKVILVVLKWNAIALIRSEINNSCSYISFHFTPKRNSLKILLVQKQNSTETHLSFRCEK